MEGPPTATKSLELNPGSPFYLSRKVRGPTAKPPKSAVTFLGPSLPQSLPQSKSGIARFLGNPARRAKKLLSGFRLIAKRSCAVQREYLSLIFLLELLVRAVGGAWKRTFVPPSKANQLQESFGSHFGACRCGFPKMHRNPQWPRAKLGNPPRRPRSAIERLGCGT